MVKLSDLGFSEGVIVETIVTTRGADGQPNAAPMGVIMENERRLVIRLFNTSLTNKNLHSNRNAVVNVTSDIDLFYKSALKEANPEGKLPSNWFVKAEAVNAPKLQAANASVEVSLAGEKPLGAERTEVTCNVKLINATKSLPKAYCRGQFATIEAIIHATRVKIFLKGNEKQKAQAQKLLEKIDICRDVVNRSAPSSRYAEIMTEINAMIEHWMGNA